MSLQDKVDAPQAGGSQENVTGVLTERRAKTTSVVMGAHWTGSPNKSIDQIGKKLSYKRPKIVISAPPDKFWTFFGHFVDTPFFWAVQRFAPYKTCVVYTRCFKTEVARTGLLLLFSFFSMSFCSFRFCPFLLPLPLLLFTFPFLPRLSVVLLPSYHKKGDTFGEIHSVRSRSAGRGQKN